MDRSKAKVDLISVLNRSHIGRQQVARIRRIVASIDDPAVARERRAKQLCPLCFEGSRVGGAMCSEQECAFCDTVLYSGNTNLDVLCMPCAKERRLCVHCGADIDLKERRKL